MKALTLATELRREVHKRTYIGRLDIIEQTQSLLKARLYLTPDLFIQVYQNDRFGTTNFARIYNQQRVYARDQLDGEWHRHNADTPDAHDTSNEGRRPVTLLEFLDEAETVISALELL